MSPAERTKLCGYWDAPEAVLRQIARVREAWLDRLGGGMTGMYAHGSLALGCFREGVSDIDLLIVTGRRLPREERLLIAGDMLSLDMLPCPLEMSAVYEGDLSPFVHPTPCQFHYSGLWTARYRQLLSGETRDCFLVDTDFADPDVACHVRLAKQSGVRLHGAPPEDALPDVPEEAFWQSISAEIADYDFHAYQPRYFASNILILCRVLSYRYAGRILSKRDGALLVKNRAPAPFSGMIGAALDSWYEGAPMPDYAEHALSELKAWLLNEIDRSEGSA